VASAKMSTWTIAGACSMSRLGWWRLGELRAEELPNAATQAFAAGCDGPSLAQLAAMEGAGWLEVEPLVARVLRDRGLAVPSEAEAVKWVADDVLGRMVVGEVAPEEAAHRLSWLWQRVADRPADEDLFAFLHLAADWDVAEKVGFDRDALRAEMLREGRELLARGGVRVR
jgi:hypothetical protein